jgi:predicted nucleic acid-binding protein
MNTVLVDSSAWIEYFKHYKEFSFIDRLIEGGFICTNDIILTELLPAIVHRKESEFEDLLKSIYQYDTEIDWQEIRDYQLMSIRHGYNKIGITDLIIAQNCIQNDLEICSGDKHFSEMAEYLPLKIYTQT